MLNTYAHNIYYISSLKEFIIKSFLIFTQGRPSNDATARAAEQLRSKLLAAETLCEELMDENEDMKRELRSMEEEIEEMQDNFRYLFSSPDTK